MPKVREVLRRWLGVTDATPAPEKKPTLGMQISHTSLGSFARQELSLEEAEKRQWTIAQPFKGVLPDGKKLAMDSSVTGYYNYAMAGGAIFAEGMEFLGYPYLSELTQRAEYRRPAEIIAKAMTRKWLKLTSAGDDDKSEKLKEIDAELQRLNVQKLFQTAAEHDGFFGRSQIFIDTGDDDPEELNKPLVADARKVAQDGIKHLQIIEPIWTYPGMYNANNPLDPTFFKPQTWFVMGREIHHTRMLTFISRPVPDLLKPAYAFGGLALSQMLKPYVDNWLRTRQSVSDLVRSFSTPVLSTALGDILNGGAADLMLTRAELFNQARDNRGLMMINKDTEEFDNVSTPLGSLDKLQAQSQEHMSGVSGIPLIILFGITPAGLNASDEAELSVFREWIASLQETDFRPKVQRAIELIQVAKWKKIDPTIGFEFQPLTIPDLLELAERRKADAETGAIYIDKGVIDPAEERERVAREENSPYSSIDVDDVPVPPDTGNEDDLGGGPELKPDNGSGDPGAA